MTDNEIIKAWEKVLNNSDEPIGEHWMVFVTTQMAKETFDMLTRQKAEIERLQHILVSFMSEVENWEHKHGIDTSNIPKIAVLGTEKENCIKQAKSEAYREFADILVDKAVGSWQPKVSVATITDTLKELTGEKRNVEH